MIDPIFDARPAMIRMLLYGGCHAQVIRDLLGRNFADRIATSLLVNFELIRQGRAFPYDELDRYDVVVFSPIENKGEYNTVHLVEACRARKVEMICYPWLEWQGYCPGASKRLFKGRFQWRYQGLAEMASTHSTFEDFYEHAVATYPDDATIAATQVRTTRLLASSEDRHDMSVRASDFIRERHRDERLFLVSDHPSLSLYVHVVEQILEAVGIGHRDFGARASMRAIEPQWRWRTPIFPRVAEALDLRFDDERWIDDEMIPGRVLDLRRYLRLYYHDDSVILGPCAGSSHLVAKGVEFPVGEATRFVAENIGAREGRESWRIVDVLSEDILPVRADDIVALDGDRWRSEWTF